MRLTPERVLLLGRALAGASPWAGKGSPPGRAEVGAPSGVTTTLPPRQAGEAASSGAEKKLRPGPAGGISELAHSETWMEAVLVEEGSRRSAPWLSGGQEVRAAAEAAAAVPRRVGAEGGREAGGREGEEGQCPCCHPHRRRQSP